MSRTYTTPYPYVPGRRRAALLALALLGMAAPTGCGEPSGGTPDAGPEATTLYSLGSVVFEPDGTRTTYIQTLASLDVQQVTNRTAIELPGNGTHLAHGGHVYVGLAEEPTIVRYTPDPGGTLRESGRVSFLNQGLTRVGFGNAFASASKAYMVSEEQYLAIVWDPEAMTILGTIDLSYLRKEGFDAEFWTVTQRDGRVYVPVRYANWDAGSIDQSVNLVIIDVATDTILATASDSRCYSGGRPVFAPNGDAYVMADGRNWSAQLFASAQNSEIPVNCLLRIPAGSLEFDPDFLMEIPSLTGGLESATELETGLDGSGIAFAKMFHRDQLGPDVEVTTDFAFWQEPAFKLWRIELGDTPSATQVSDLPFSALAWEGTAVDGKLYVGESPDYARSQIFEIDPAANRAAPLFEMEGTFYGLHKLR